MGTVPLITKLYQFLNFCGIMGTVPLITKLYQFLNFCIHYVHIAIGI